MSSTATQTYSANWLTEHGPGELEAVFRAIAFHPATPILLTDSDSYYRDASVGASKLLGLPRERLIGHSLDDFAEAAVKPAIPELWNNFLKEGQQAGTVRLALPDGTPQEVSYTARRNILPVRHLVVLQKKKGEKADIAPPASVRDFALFLMDRAGTIVAWFEGAERIYGYSSAEAIGQHGSFAEAGPDSAKRLPDTLTRAIAEGHSAIEGWLVRKDGSRFWANIITAALNDEQGNLQGFGRVVRDFSDRHERDEKLRRNRLRLRQPPVESSVLAIVSGEFDRIPEANDTFLELVGYTREDLLTGRLSWPDLTPPEFLGLDELAHEEGLRFGACTPFEKELIRKDGTRIPVLISTAVLKLSPFRWITFVKDLRERGEAQDAAEDVAADSVRIKSNFDEMIGGSAAMKRVMAQIEVVAPADATVLVLGETGTGKELVARAVHRISPRRNMPFISLNCAAIPTGLLESELFGYERGAFTGALQQKIGRFEMAHKGTLFLDEVGDIPLDLQPKLLRALQEKSFERLGGTRTIPIDVRLVAATNRNLAQMMGDKLFRSDLYYRLKVFPITTPPLREHPEDIPALVRHFTARYSMKMNRSVEKITSSIMSALVSWPWPGNVRELENFIERSVILSPGATLRAPIEELVAAAPETTGSTLEEVERDYITRVFRDTGGVVSLTATRLGLPRTTLNAMMTKLGISRRDL